MKSPAGANDLAAVDTGDAPARQNSAIDLDGALVSRVFFTVERHQQHTIRVNYIAVGRPEFGVPLRWHGNAFDLQASSTRQAK